MIDKKLLSIIVPAYNEQDNILVLYDATLKVLNLVRDHYDFEFIFVDDGSCDRTWQVLEQLTARDVHVTALSLSRNFGGQAALMAGYDRAYGDAIISLDADMQHPPQLILEMLKKWEDGAEIVYARRIARKENFLKRYSSLLFHRLLDLISDVKIPRNVSDFRLIDKKVLTVIRSCHEKTPYMRGLVAWVGFKYDFVDCPYYERYAGVTGYTWKKMMGLAWDGITGFSLFPVRLAAYIGFFILVVVGGMSVGAVLGGLFLGTHVGLTFWLIQLFAGIFGLQFLVIWLLGEYIGAMQRQGSDRPLYIIARILNCTSSKDEQ